MHLLILGGSGINGRLVIKDALARGHTITALVREPASLAELTRAVPANTGGLTLVEGTPQSAEDLRRAVTTPQPAASVFITLNIRRTSGSPFAPLSPDSPIDLMSSSTRSLLAVLADLRLTPKIVVNSTQGAVDSFSSLSLPARVIFQRAEGMRVMVEDHNRVDAMVRKSGLPFVMARPGGLSDGPADKVRAFADNGKGSPWMSMVSRESLARWMVSAAEGSEWDGKSPVLSK